MKPAALLLLVALGANAQGFQDEPTCYSWSGGHKSAGSFSKCTPELHALAPKPVVTPPQPVVTPVAPTPIMMPVCVNPTPEVVKPRPKPKPKPRPKPPQC